jgi:hypothetical protein
MTAPTSIGSAAPGPLTDELLAGLVQRAARPDFDKLQAQLRSSGYCARPVRLRGQIETCDHDGRRRVWSTKDEPEGVLRKACGNRREAVCPPCAERYRQDAYHLIAAGLRGGKGVPDTVAEHPAVFFTLTAPSFGAVHTQLLGPDGRPLPCRARRARPVCPHGLPLYCRAVHADGDPCLGEPLCPQCFDYRGAVVWNNTVGALWRYTTIYLPRALARLTGLTQDQLRRQVRPAYVKVAEYQRRGLVHLHVIARLDRAMCRDRRHEIHPPPARFDNELLEHAIRAAVEDVSAPVVDELGGGRVRWGGQLDMHQLSTGEQRGEIAGYLAKYATKSTEQAGGLLHRVAPEEIDRAPVREHVKRYMRTGFELHKAAATRSRPLRPAPALDVETNWNPSGLAARAGRAVGHDEPIRLRRHDGSTQLGRIQRLTTTEPARQGATLVVELDDDAEPVHLADIASIGPADRMARRRERRDPRLAACAHALWYRGHCLTKSRRYSTTFKQLRADREAFVHAQILARSRDATQRALASAAERIVTLAFDGIGHVTTADAYLAASAAARAREGRLAARLERDMTIQMGGGR